MKFRSGRPSAGTRQDYFVVFILVLSFSFAEDEQLCQSDMTFVQHTLFHLY